MPLHHSNNQLMKQEGPVLVKTIIAEPYNNVNQFWQDFPFMLYQEDLKIPFFTKLLSWPTPKVVLPMALQ